MITRLKLQLKRSNLESISYSISLLVLMIFAFLNGLDSQVLSVEEPETHAIIMEELNNLIRKHV